MAFPSQVMRGSLFNRSSISSQVIFEHVTQRSLNESDTLRGRLTRFLPFTDGLRLLLRDLFANSAGCDGPRLLKFAYFWQLLLRIRFLDLEHRDGLLWLLFSDFSRLLLRSLFLSPGDRELPGLFRFSDVLLLLFRNLFTNAADCNRAGLFPFSDLSRLLLRDLLSGLESRDTTGLLTFTDNSRPLFGNHFPDSEDCDTAGLRCRLLFLLWLPKSCMRLTTTAFDPFYTILTGFLWTTLVIEIFFVPVSTLLLEAMFFGQLEYMVLT
jgi:hypothetical protein